MTPAKGFGAAPPQTAEESPEDDMEGGTPATPEQQEKKDLIVAQALDLIAKPENKEVRQGVIGVLSSSKDPVKALATAASNLVDAVEKSAAQNGYECPPEILLNAGSEIMQHLADLAAKKGIHEFSEDEIKRAFLMAVDMYRLQNQDRFDPEMAKQELAEAEGDPEIAAAAQEFAGAEQPQPGGPMLPAPQPQGMA